MTMKLRKNRINESNSKSPLHVLAWGLVVFIFWIGIWWLAAFLLDKELILPSPVSVAKAWWTLAGTSAFWLSVLYTVGRVLLGFVCGVFVGGGLGFLTYYVHIIDRFFTPIMRIIRAIPVASFILMAFFWFTVGWLPVFIAALMVTPLMWQSVRTALDNTVDDKLLELAIVCRLSNRKTFFKIVWPSVLPSLIQGAVTALGFAWKSEIAAEVLCLAIPSIGRELQGAKSLYEMPQVFAWTVTVCLFSLIFEKIVAHVRIKRKGDTPV